MQQGQRITLKEGRLKGFEGRWGGNKGRWGGKEWSQEGG